MTINAFNEACKRIAISLDPSGYEERRWASEEGLNLEKAAALVQACFKGQSDLTVREEQTKVRYIRSFDLILQEDVVASLVVRVFSDYITIFAVEAN